MKTQELRKQAMTNLRNTIDMLQGFAYNSGIRILAIEVDNPEEHDEVLKAHKGVKITYNDRVGRGL